MDRRALPLIVVATVALGGCGLTVPSIKEPWDSDFPGDSETPSISGTAQIEYEVKKRVYCELRKAVQAASIYKQTEVDFNSGKQTIKPMLPEDWGAQITLSFQVDESTSLNPGLSLNTPMHNASVNFNNEYLGPSSAVASALTYPFLSVPQSYAFGLGGTLSATSTRIDKFNPYYSMKELYKKIEPGTICDEQSPLADPFKRLGFKPARSSPFLIEASNLGLQEWLVGAMFTNQQIPSVPPEAPKPPTRAEIAKTRAKLAAQGYTAAEISQIVAAKAGGAGGGGGGTKPDTISIEIKFVIVSSGNATPTWKLVRVSSNTGAPFVSVGRIRTHDLIITLGPSGAATANSHLASEISSAISSANRVLLGQP